MGTILITGGSGYIGSLLAGRAQEHGHEVRVLDSLLHGQEEIASEQEGKGVEVIRGDVRDPAAPANALDDAEGVVHLAAIVGDPACARDRDRDEVKSMLESLVARRRRRQVERS